MFHTNDAGLITKGNGKGDLIHSCTCILNFIITLIYGNGKLDSIVVMLLIKWTCLLKMEPF